MAYVTRAMKQRAAADRLESAHGPALVTMRLLDQAFADQAIADRLDRYPELTPDNSIEAMRFQERRIVELRSASAAYQTALHVIACSRE